MMLRFYSLLPSPPFFNTGAFFMRTNAFSPITFPNTVPSAKATPSVAEPAKLLVQNANVDSFTIVSAQKAENRSGLNTPADLEFLQRYFSTVLGHFETNLQSLKPKLIQLEGQNVLTIPLTINDRFGKQFQYELGKGKSWDGSPHYYLDVWEPDSEKNRLFESHKPFRMMNGRQHQSTNTVQTMGGEKDYHQLLRQLNTQSEPLPITVSNGGIASQRKSTEQLSQHQEAVNRFFNDTFTRISNLVANFDQS
jgi:hypothetical protein